MGNMLSSAGNFSKALKEYYKSKKYLPKFIEDDEDIPELTIEECFVNLTLISQSEHTENEERFRQNKRIDSNVLSAEDDIYAFKQAIDIEKLFEIKQPKIQETAVTEQTQDDEKAPAKQVTFRRNSTIGTPKTEPTKLLIYGRAGIGKTTLVHRIAYKWAHGDLWKDKFNTVIWVPLRNLTHDWQSALPKKVRDNDSFLTQFIYYCCCKGVNPKLAGKIINGIEYSLANDKTLLMLDGYDEVASIHRFENAVTFLVIEAALNLQKAKIILTSRPNSVSKDLQKKFDRQLENIGLTDSNITKFITKFYQSNNGQIDQLLKFIATRKTVASMAHIPINLMLLCIIWNNAKEELEKRAEITLTYLYGKVVDYLMRRYLEKNNLTPAGISVHDIAKHQIEEREEYNLLANIAYHAMKDGQIIIDHKILNQMQLPADQIRNLLKIGIFKIVGEDKNILEKDIYKDCYFIHLTFQEYFASVKLTRLLASNVIQELNEGLEFVRSKKYSRKFERVIWLASGILAQNATSEAGKRALNNFWYVMLNENLDLGHLKHALLVAKCLEESGEYLLPNREQILLQIKQIIEENIIDSIDAQSYLAQAPGIIKEISLEEYLLDKLEKVVSADELEKVINAMGNLGLRSDEYKKKLIAMLTADESSIEQKIVAASNLGKIARGDEELRKLFEARLIDENYEIVVDTIIDVIKEIYVSNEKLIQKMIDIAGNIEVNNNIKQRSIRTLSRVGYGSDLVINFLFELAVNNKNLRDAITDALVYIQQNNNSFNDLLSEFAHKNTKRLFEDDMSMYFFFAEVHAKTGITKSQIIDDLIKATKVWSNEIRKNAVMILGYTHINTHEVKDTLMVALKDRDELVSNGAGEALERIASSNRYAIPVSTLKDNDDLVIKYDSKELEKIDSENLEAIYSLIAALKDENPYRRKYAAEELGTIASNNVYAIVDSIKALITALSDKDQAVRSYSAAALMMPNYLEFQNRVYLGEYYVDKLIYTILIELIMGLDRDMKREQIIRLLKNATNYYGYITDVCSFLINKHSDHNGLFKNIEETLAHSITKELKDRVVKYHFMWAGLGGEYVGDPTYCATLALKSIEVDTSQAYSSLVEAFRLNFNNSKSYSNTARIALEALCNMSHESHFDTRTTNALIAALKDKDLRSSAAAVLGKIAKYKNALIETINNHDVHLRSQFAFGFIISQNETGLTKDLAFTYFLNMAEEQQIQLLTHLANYSFSQVVAELLTENAISEIREISSAAQNSYIAIGKRDKTALKHIVNLLYNGNDTNISQIYTNILAGIISDEKGPQDAITSLILKLKDNFNYLPELFKSGLINLEDKNILITEYLRINKSIDLSKLLSIAPQEYLSSKYFIEILIQEWFSAVTLDENGNLLMHNNDQISINFANDNIIAKEAILRAFVKPQQLLLAEKEFTFAAPNNGENLEEAEITYQIIRAHEALIMQGIIPTAKNTLEYYNQLIEFFPQIKALYFERGKIYEENEDLPLALSNYEMASRLDKDNYVIIKLARDRVRLELCKQKQEKRIEEIETNVENKLAEVNERITKVEYDVAKLKFEVKKLCTYSSEITDYINDEEEIDTTEKELYLKLADEINEIRNSYEQSLKLFGQAQIKKQQELEHQLANLQNEHQIIFSKLDEQQSQYLELEKRFSKNIEELQAESNDLILNIQKQIEVLHETNDEKSVDSSKNSRLKEIFNKAYSRDYYLYLKTLINSSYIGAIIVASGKATISSNNNANDALGTALNITMSVTDQLSQVPLIGIAANLLNSVLNKIHERNVTKQVYSILVIIRSPREAELIADELALIFTEQRMDKLIEVSDIDEKHGLIENLRDLNEKFDAWKSGKPRDNKAEKIAKEDAEEIMLKIMTLNFPPRTNHDLQEHAKKLAEIIYAETNFTREEPQTLPSRDVATPLPFPASRILNTEIVVRISPRLEPVYRLKATQIAEQSVARLIVETRKNNKYPEKFALSTKQIALTNLLSDATYKAIAGKDIDDTEFTQLITTISDSLKLNLKRGSACFDQSGLHFGCKLEEIRNPKSDIAIKLNKLLKDETVQLTASNISPNSLNI